MDAIVAQVIGDIALGIMISLLLGAAARRCGQPTVIGQILGGLLLGPSLLGAAVRAPDQSPVLALGAAVPDGALSDGPSLRRQGAE